MSPATSKNLSARDRARNSTTKQLAKIQRIEDRLTKFFELNDQYEERRSKHHASITADVLAPLKELGLSDAEIAEATGLSALEIKQFLREHRSTDEARQDSSRVDSMHSAASSLQSESATA